MERKQGGGERFDTSPVCSDKHRVGSWIWQSLCLILFLFRLVGMHEEKHRDDNSRKEDISSSSLLDEDHKPIVTKTLSFKSNRSMWENIDKETELTEKSRTLDRPKKKSANTVAAPDLLQGLLEKSLADPGGRSRSGSNISAWRLSPGQDVPDGLCNEKKEDIKDTEV